MIENEPNFTSENTGILLMSHGSRHPLASETFNKIADMFREETDFKVNVGYMEIHEPNIPKALDELVKGTKIDTIIAVPVFLAHGMHTTRDIPKILRLTDDEATDHKNTPKHHSHEEKHHSSNEDHSHEEKHHSTTEGPDHEEKHQHGHHHHHDLEKIDFNGKIIYTEPLGADSLVIEIIKNRVNNALKIK